MSIFSSIGNFVTNAYNTVSNAVSGLLRGGSSQTASASNAFGSAAYNAKSVSTGAQPASGVGSAYYTPSNPNVYTTPSGSYGTTNASGGIGNASYGPQLPVSINAGQQKSASGSGFSGGGSLSIPSSSYLLQPSAPRTISTSSLGVSSSAPTIGSSGGGAQPLTLSSAPTVTNPGTVNTTGLAGTLAGYYKRNADGTYEPVNNQETDLQTAQKQKDLYDAILGKRPDVNSDPEIMAAREQRQKIQQALLSPTAELNAVIAQQNRDLLQLRSTGAQEGVTEAVYGQQSNAINYNAAIRALPLQASIASLQGDLKLAQDYLTELTSIKTEQINNQYEYNKGLFTAIQGALDKKDQRAYEEMKTANEQAYQMTRDNINAQDEWSRLAIQNGQSNLVKTINSINPSSPNFRDVLGQIVGSIVPTANAKAPEIKSINGVDMQWNPTTSKWETPSVTAPTTTGTTLQQAQAQGSIAQVDELLKSGGLASSVGTSALSRKPVGFWDSLVAVTSVIGLPSLLGGTYRTLTGERQNFIAGVDQLKSSLNLETLINAKSRGATFGALSDNELRVLASAATKIGTWEIKKGNDVVGYNASEKDFKKELDKINNFAKLDYIRKGGDPLDVNAYLQSDGTVWTQNSDGSVTRIQ